MNKTWSEKDIRERLSISTFVFKVHRSISVKTLSQLSDHGFNYVELWESPDQFDLTKMDSMKHVIKDCREAGVQICAYHASHTNLSEIESLVERTKSIDRCKRQIDTMLAAGANIWGSHIRGIDGGTEECLNGLLRHIEKTSAIIVLENFNRENRAVWDRLAVLKRINHPQLGMVLDIGHVRNSEGINPMTLPGGPSEILDLCRGNLAFLHLHGFVEKDHYPPFSQGDRIQWTELFQKLYEISYKGFFNFEPKGKPFHKNSLEITSMAPSIIAERIQQRGDIQ